MAGKWLRLEVAEGGVGEKWERPRVWRHGVRPELGLLNTLLERKEDEALEMRTVQNICVQLCGFKE